ncbi:MAG TPA: RNA polymerase factor sigma-54 [Candidatus Angelobacter sp.]|nr:RNA polymerase factor sigma-54 [Candidatus Angelobacter sp.]
MAVRQRMDLRQTQTLVMTPQLQQAIKLLELSSQELSAYVERELEQNPLLERDDATGDSGTDPSPEPGDDSEPSAAGASDPLDASDFAKGAMMPDAPESPLDVDYDNLWTNDGADAPAALSLLSAGTRGRSDGTEGEGSSTVEHTLSRAISLREHLTEQINVDLADPMERLIAFALIEQLDEAGYFSGDLAPIADRLGCPPAKVQATLVRLQQFDPPGIFARSLAECLALQLKDRDRLDPAMQKLLEHLDLLAQGERDRLMRLCGVDAADLAQMVSEIRALNPKPAEAFSTTPMVPVVPDILIRRASDGGWLVELNPDALPRVLMNESYVAKIRRSATDKASREYINDRVTAGNWLVRALQQRATTILKVAAEIVRQQDGFFRRGVQHLRPLTRREVADTIEMHESTVSRVTVNKYIATPRGLFELRYFFGSALADADGGVGHSAEAVRTRIQTLIEAEPATAVLSDDRIAEILRTEGIEIARRTVAKYRESLRIPSSSQRRRARALHLR